MKSCWFSIAEMNNRLFPDCAIIITHRNPLQAVTSYASMMGAMMKHRDFDQQQLGPVVLDYLANKVQASLAQRQHIDAARIFDGQFNDFIQKPLQFVEAIYAYFNLPLQPDTLAAFQQYANAHPMHQHGKHDYQLAAFGLSEQGVLDRFEDYITAFNISLDC